ncbi:hypothetical protein Pfo_020239 [Paulownia fortunei]|nr:hypothetical protein Pfo_020239 [Paulownia fortunei]
MRLLQLAFLVALASGLSAILIYIAGVSNLDGPFRLSTEDLEALKSLQIHFQKCVVLWEVDDQRQNIINQSGINSSLFSFH